LSGVRHFVQATEADWRPDVCSRCADTEAIPRCRLQLREQLQAGQDADLEAQIQLVEAVAERVKRFSQSFRWERHRHPCRSGGAHQRDGLVPGLAALAEGHLMEEPMRYVSIAVGAMLGANLRFVVANWASDTWGPESPTAPS
jgi:hypothetical protein